MFSLICVWINGWVNNREADDLSSTGSMPWRIIAHWSKRSLMAFIWSIFDKHIYSLFVLVVLAFNKEHIRALYNWPSLRHTQHISCFCKRRHQESGEDFHSVVSAWWDFGSLPRFIPGSIIGIFYADLRSQPMRDDANYMTSTLTGWGLAQPYIENGSGGGINHVVVSCQRQHNAGHWKSVSKPL